MVNLDDLRSIWKLKVKLIDYERDFYLPIWYLSLYFYVNTSYKVKDISPSEKFFPFLLLSDRKSYGAIFQSSLIIAFNNESIPFIQPAAAAVTRLAGTESPDYHDIE